MKVGIGAARLRGISPALHAVLPLLMAIALNWAISMT